MHSHRHAGFTLLEICLALLIGLLIIVLAVPSISGLLAEKRLKDSYLRFNRLATAAKLDSVTAQRVCQLVWDREGITLRRAARSSSIENPGDVAEERLVFGKDESFKLQRTAALQKNAPDEWTFWPNGTCEPAQIAFQGSAGSWLIKYDPLTGQATFLRSEVR